MYGSEENSRAMQDLATAIDELVAAWVASHPNGVVDMMLRAALPVAGKDMADVSTFYGDWDNSNQPGEGWAKGFAKEKVARAPVPPLTRAQRRARGKRY